MKTLHATRVKLEAGSPRNIIFPSNGSKGRNKRKWGQGKLGPHDDKENS
jgi:hypothetical protein